MIAISDEYYNSHSRDHVCPRCGHVTHTSSSSSYNDSYDPSYIEPEPEEEILQHIHPKLFKKQIGRLIQFYIQPLFNRKVLFCVSGYLPKRIKRIRKSK